jgi:hypothetical protein
METNVLQTEVLTNLAEAQSKSKMNFSEQRVDKLNISEQSTKCLSSTTTHLVNPFNRTFLDLQKNTYFSTKPSKNKKTNEGDVKNNHVNSFETMGLKHVGTSVEENKVENFTKRNLEKLRDLSERTVEKDQIFVSCESKITNLALAAPFLNLDSSEQSLDKLYLSTLTEKEYKAYEIAKNCLGTSFQLEKSNGYLAYIQNK